MEYLGDEFDFRELSCCGFWNGYRVVDVFSDCAFLDRYGVLLILGKCVSICF